MSDFKRLLLIKNDTLHLLSEDGVVVFCMLQASFKFSFYDEINFSIENLLLNYGKSKTDIKHIKNGIGELENLNMIKKVNKQYQINKDIFSIDGKFSKIDFDTFQLIKKDNIVKHCFYMFNNIVSSSGLGCRPLEYFAEVEGVSVSTIIRKNKILKDKKIIYFHPQYYDKDKKSNAVTTYEKYNNQEQQYHDANWRRSVAAKYNRYCKNPATYSPAQVKELKMMCEQYNHYQKDKSLQKDLKIFANVLQ